MPRGAYEKAWSIYAERGWLALPVTGKLYPPVGATGRDGVVSDANMALWAIERGDDNVALRAQGWVAIDVDVYDDKRGDLAIAELAGRLGKDLPRTFTSTARGKKSPSRQRFYSVPEGVELSTKIGNAVEIVQFRHRYSVVWPSKHPVTGDTYTWYDFDGKKMDGPPHVLELPPLPDVWLDYLSQEPHRALVETDTVLPWRQLAESFTEGDTCFEIRQYGLTIDDTVIRAGHIGHDDAVRLALKGFMLGREGHVGASAELHRLYDLHGGYLAATRGRRKSEADAVFRDMADLAQRKALAETCTCPVPGSNELSDDDLDDGDAERERIRLLFAQPIMVGRQFNLPVAGAQFLHDHPVKRYADSTGAAFIWTGERWELDDLTHHCRVWLEAKIGNDMTQARVKDLAWYVGDAAERVDDDDVDTRFISLANGLLNWQTEELVPHSREVFTYYHLPWAWNPKAKPGKWAEWLNSTIDEAQRPFVEEVLGYAISPVHDLKCALALTGPGGGGKSTLINVVTSLVGRANTAALAPNALAERFNRATLHGKLVNAAGDVGAETMRNVGVLKSVIAADSITAEHKHKAPFTFRPNAFILASFNALPSTESNDSGFWDRWLALRFNRRFNKDGAPNNYYRDEMPHNRSIMEGVLVVAVRALQRLRERGSFDTSAFFAAKQDWRQEVDPVAAFVAEYLVPDPSGTVNGTAMHRRYTAAMEDWGHKPRGKQTFNLELERYLNETMPMPGGDSHKLTDYHHRVNWVGVKVVHEPVTNPFEIGGQPPDELYGKHGWTLRTGL